MSGRTAKRKVDENLRNVVDEKSAKKPRGVGKGASERDGQAVSCDEAVKEFVRLVGVKETRLKGLIKFDRNLRTSDEATKCEIILKYLQRHSECVELFNILEERIEERSLLEVQIVLEILETIILHLTGEDVKSKAKSTNIISTLFTKHRKLVYNLLNSSSTTDVMIAMLKLLTAIVMQGSAIAKEMLTTFDFTHKTFRLLAIRRQKKPHTGNVRACFIKFVLAFFISEDPALIQQVIQIKGFATSIFKNLDMDPPELIQLVLSTLLVKVVQNAAILRKTKILLFTSYSLVQLAKIYNCNNNNNLVAQNFAIQELLHSFMIELCTSSSGIAFENKLGMLAPRSNNPVLLSFLNSLQKTLNNNFLVELVVATLMNSPDLVEPYLHNSGMILEPRNSEQWIKNFHFLTKLYTVVPMPCTIVNNITVVPQDISGSKFVSLVSPANVKRNILTKGVLHSDVVVQTTTLNLMNVILRRSVDLVRSSKISVLMKSVFREELAKLLPSLQSLISLRECLLNRTKLKNKEEETILDETTQQDSAIVSQDEARVLLSQALVAMRFYQTLWPSCFTQASYDLWKILPKSEDEQELYDVSSQESMLEILVESSQHNIRGQVKNDSFQGLSQILCVYVSSKNVQIRNLSEQIVTQLFLDTGVFDGNEEELDLWLDVLCDQCQGDGRCLVKFLEKVYNILAERPCDFVEVVMDCAATTASEEKVAPASFEANDKKKMPFSPLVAAAFEHFGEIIKQQDTQESVEIIKVTEFLNYAVLELWARQCDARSLHATLINCLGLQNKEPSTICLPSQTKHLLNYLKEWSHHRLTAWPDKGQALEEDSRVDEEEVFKRFRKRIHNRSHDFASLVQFLKCNPVSLLDIFSETEFSKIVNKLSCCQLVQQLVLALSKSWSSLLGARTSSDISELSTALLSSAKKVWENWESVIYNCLFLMHIAIELHTRVAKNEQMFTQICKLVTDALRITLNQVWIMYGTAEGSGCIDNTSLMLTDDVRDYDVIGDDDVYDVTSGSGVDDVISGGGVDDDVITMNDDVTCGNIDDVTEASANQREDIFSDYFGMVFGHDVVKRWFCIDLINDETTMFVSNVVSDCVVSLISSLKTQFAKYRHLAIWKPYFGKMVEAVKKETLSEQMLNTDINLPFNVAVSSLIDIFCDNLPAESLKDLIVAFLVLPKKKLRTTLPNNEETRQGNILTEKGKTLVSLLDSLFSKGMTCLEQCSFEELEDILTVLTALDCEQVDEMVAKHIPKFCNASERIVDIVLMKCLHEPTPVRVETVVIMLCSSAGAFVREKFEEYLANERKAMKKGEEGDGGKSLWVEEWELFVPLLNYYLGLVREADTSTKTTRNCLKFIAKVSWSNLTDLILGRNNSSKCSKHHVQLTSHLLQLEDTESEDIDLLFSSAIQPELLGNWQMNHVDIIERLLQFLLKHSSSEKYIRKRRSIFVFACMKKITSINRKDQTQLRENLLNYLEIFGKESLRLQVKDHFTKEEFIGLINTFIKSSLRSYFSCAQTLRVLGVVIDTVYSACDDQSLTPLTTLYQFILSHSKFLEIFLANNIESVESHNNSAKSALVDLLQTVVDLDSKCCQPSHVSLILGAYNAKLHPIDQKLLRLLFSYESYLGEIATVNPVLWGEAAIEGYSASKDNSTILFHQPNIGQVLELLDTRLLLQSAKHFPISRQLEPVVSKYTVETAQWYDPCFLLPLFSFLMDSGCEVDCKRFIDKSGLAYTISALTSTHEEMRQVAYQILTRFLHHLSGSRFREKQQIAHLLHCFQNGILQPNTRVSSLIVSFMTRALHIFFYPEDPLYVSVNCYMLQKSFIDVRDVPLFLRLINSADLEYRSERIWLLHLLVDGLRDSMDYYCCKKYYVFQQLFSLYNCSITDKHQQHLILKVLSQVSNLRDPVYDLCLNYAFVPWLQMLVSGNDIRRDTLHNVLAILANIWFTLIGKDVSRDVDCDEAQVAQSDNPLPKNISSQLLLVCSNVLHRHLNVENWDKDCFVPFLRLLSSLLAFHNNNLPTEIKFVVSTQDVLKLLRVWKYLFNDIDIVKTLISRLHLKQQWLHNSASSSEWLSGLVAICGIITESASTLEEEKQSNCRERKLLSVLCDCVRTSTPLGSNVEAFLEAKLREKLQPFLENELDDNLTSCRDVLSIFNSLK